MVTLKRLMNIMALSVFLGTVSTPVMAINICSKVEGAACAAAGFLISSFAWEQGWLVQAVIDARDNQHNTLVQTIVDGIQKGTHTMKDIPTQKTFDLALLWKVAKPAVYCALLTVGALKLLEVGYNKMTETEAVVSTRR
jgi:hypothetical protein